MARRISVPSGGHVEANESPTQAMLREIQEELAVTVDPNDLEFMCVAARNTEPTQYVAYEFIIKNKSYDFVNAEPDKCSELVWVSLSDLPEDIIPHFDVIIRNGLLKNTKYLEIDFKA